MTEHNPCRLPCRVREVVGRVAGTGLRGGVGPPARIPGQPVLFHLFHPVGITAGFHDEVGPVGDRHLHFIRRTAEPEDHRNGLTRRCSGTDLGAAMSKGDATLWREFGLGQRSFVAMAEILLHAPKSNAVILSGMSDVVRVLARGPTGPERMRACPLEYLVGADVTGWHRTLGVL